MNNLKIFALVCATTFCLLGCQPAGPSAELLSARKSLTAATEPAGAISLEEARKLLLGEPTTNAESETTETGGGDTEVAESTPTEN